MGRRSGTIGEADGHEPSAAPTSRVGERALAAATFASILAALPVFLLGALSVLVREELHFTEALLGAAVSTFFGASALVAGPGGQLGERIGARRGLTVAAIGSASALLGIAAFVRSWAHLVAFLAIGGIANAVAQPASNLAIARAVPATRQGLAYGLKKAAVPSASLLAGAAVPVVGLTIGWRWAFALGATGMILVLLTLPGRTAFALGESGHPDPTDVVSRPLVTLAVAAGFGAAAGNAVTAFYVPSLVDSGFSAGSAGLWLAVGSVCGIGGRVLWGWVADRHDGGDLWRLGLLLAVGALGFLLLGFARSPVVLGFATALAFSAGWGWPGLFVYTVVQHHKDAPAAATGVTAIGGSIGGIVGPLGFGAVAEWGSYTAAWLCAAGALLAAAGLVQFRRRQ